MKKYIILSLVSFSLITVSCSDEDKGVNTCDQIIADFESSVEKFIAVDLDGSSKGLSACENYVSSLKKLVDGGCKSLSNYYPGDEEYEAIINGDENGPFCSPFYD